MKIWLKISSEIRLFLATKYGQNNMMFVHLQVTVRILKCFTKTFYLCFKKVQYIAKRCIFKFTYKKNLHKVRQTNCPLSI